MVPFVKPQSADAIALSSADRKQIKDAKHAVETAVRLDEVANARVTAMLQKRGMVAAPDPEIASFDDLVAHNDHEKRSDNLLDLAREVARGASAKRAAEEARFNVIEGDVEHSLEERRVEADAKALFGPAFHAWVQQGVEHMAAINASKERTALANERRGGRPFIVDAETRVRQQPGKPTAAVYDEVDRWVNAAGEPVPDQIRNDHGNWVWNPAAKEKKPIRYLVQAEQMAIPHTPTSLTEVIRLFDLAGKAVWPPAAF